MSAELVRLADPPGRPRFGHGSRVPGWDEAVDLTKPPATVPDPATTPVPDELRERDRGGDGQIPGPPLGRDPGAARRAGASTAGARRRRSTRSRR